METLLLEYSIHFEHDSEAKNAPWRRALFILSTLIWLVLTLYRWDFFRRFLWIWKQLWMLNQSFDAKRRQSIFKSQHVKNLHNLKSTHLVFHLKPIKLHHWRVACCFSVPDLRENFAFKKYFILFCVYS